MAKTPITRGKKSALSSTSVIQPTDYERKKKRKICSVIARRVKRPGVFPLGSGTRPEVLMEDSGESKVALKSDLALVRRDFILHPALCRCCRTSVMESAAGDHGREKPER